MNGVGCDIWAYQSKLGMIWAMELENEKEILFEQRYRACNVTEEEGEMTVYLPAHSFLTQSLSLSQH